ncbi:MAG: leucine-rich repeat domain-containing protein, partial [Candidatus Hermodarchaeota archaeon]
QTLILTRNQLTELPSSLGRLESMQRFSVDRNKLVTLPESFGDLKLLQELNLGSNRLTSLPESFGKLNSLVMLRLIYNQLGVLPTSLLTLTNLRVLSLAANELESLPESFGNLTSLQELDLRNNKLTILPESFGNLKSLEQLRLRDNEFTALPGSIWPLVALKTLELDSNPLDEEAKEMSTRSIPEILDFCRKIATLHIFLSHAEADYHKIIKIEEISEFLEGQDEIYKAYYSERDLQGNFEEFMRKNVPICQVLLFFATKNSLKSEPCRLELQLAIDNSLQIIPILHSDLDWSDLDEIELYDEAGAKFQLSGVKGIAYSENTIEFGNILYEHIYKLKRSSNLFDTKQARVDRFFQDFAKIINSYIKSNEYKGLIKKRFIEIDEFHRKFKDNSVNDLEFLERVFHILKNS